MKKITLFLILINCICFGQIKQLETTKRNEIGKIAPMGVFIVSLEKIDNSIYVFTYRDVQYSTINEYKHFSFDETGNDLENLYSIISNGFNDMPKEPIMLEMKKGEYLFLNYTKMMGVKNVQFGVSTITQPNGYCRGLTKKEINKLFGKI